MAVTFEDQNQSSTLSQKESDYVEFLQEIYAGRVRSHELVEMRVPEYPSEWRIAAYELLDARLLYGTEKFWTCYDAMATDFKPLRKLRCFIGGRAEREQREAPTQTPPATVPPQTPTSQPDATPTEPAEEYIGTIAATVTETRIDWLWEGRIALGMATMLDGDPGQGKSMMTVDLAARVTRGRRMPDDTPGLTGGAGVVMMNLEDNFSNTIVPRLRRAGADLSRVALVSTIPATDPQTGYTYRRPFSLAEDLEKLAREIDRVQARLLVIDPIMSIVGNRDTHKDNEVRMMLAPLVALLEEKHVAGVMLRHMTKGGGSNALYRGMGSIAFIGLARSGMVVAKDPYDESRNLLVHTKGNLSKQTDTLAFHVTSEESDGLPYVSWDGACDYSMQEIFSPSSSSTSEAPKRTGARDEILRVLEEHAPEALSPTEVSQELPDIQFDAVRTALSRMVKDGTIEQPSRGRYHVTAR